MNAVKQGLLERLAASPIAAKFMSEADKPITDRRREMFRRLKETSAELEVHKLKELPKVAALNDQRGALIKKLDDLNEQLDVARWAYESREERLQREIWALTKEAQTTRPYSVMQLVEVRRQAERTAHDSGDTARLDQLSKLATEMSEALATEGVDLDKEVARLRAAYAGALAVAGQQ